VKIRPPYPLNRKLGESGIPYGGVVKNRHTDLGEWNPGPLTCKQSLKCSVLIEFSWLIVFLQLDFK
jgi:hypothetical protein